jgi:Cytochrome b5-like Heme/Steroid binding domain
MNKQEENNNQLKVEPSPPANQGGSQPIRPAAPPVNQDGMFPPPFFGENRPAPHNQEGLSPPPPPEGEMTPPPHPPDGTPLPNVWIYEGVAYDLTEFIAKHPGGQFFIGRTKNRDITTIVNIFHPHPEKVKKIIQKYSLGRMGRPEDIHPKYNAPAFLFREHFNGWRDTPRYDFQNKEQLLNKIKTRLNAPEIKEKIAQMDFLFDVVSVLLFIIYIAIQFVYLDFRQYLPFYLFVPLMVMVRISLAGVGHYLIHRPQVGFNKAFANVFDINYVPLALVVTDGHTLLHHPFTQTEVDIKKNVFTFLLELPRFYRVPVHTFQKIGHTVTGMFARIIELCLLAFKAGVKDMYGSFWLGLPHFLGSFGIHFLLLGELILFTLNGAFWAWFLQFFITIWISTFMIVASHDFEIEKTEASPSLQPNWAEKDWAIEQIKNSYDLTMIGNKYIDCFLSAGLSPHRVHHVLPQQKSGFANIFSEAIVKEESAKFGVEWLEPKNFFFDRLPILLNYYLAVPSRMAQKNNYGFFKEHFHPQALLTTLDYIIKGWAGIGSI